MFEFDPAKDAKNRLKHGLSLARIEDFDWSSALIDEDSRKDYGERRHSAIGCLDGGQIVSVVFTVREQNIRVISLRPANRKERIKWRLI